MTQRRRGGGSVSLARQILLLQVLVLAVVISAALLLAVSDARRTSQEQATARAVAVAVTVADSPALDAGLAGADPSASLQPFAERVRTDTGTDFVVVMSPAGIRWTHPDPANIGRPFLGSISEAQQGRVGTELYTGTLGPSVRAVVPVVRDQRVVALVGAGITMEKVNASLRANLPGLLVAAVAVLAVGFLGALLITKRLRRQTHGLGEQELGRMYEYYDAVLHSVREGLVLLDREHRVQLVNAEGRRLLGLSPDAVGYPIGEVGLPTTLTHALAHDDTMVDEIHLVDARMLVVNRRTAGRSGRDLGSVVTFRDHTEIQAMAGELDTVRSMADSLRAQNHEAANRLHTVVSLIEIGRNEDAVQFATHELEVSQRLTDHVVSSVENPVVAALLLGKTAQAAERGVLLELTGSSLEDMSVEPVDAVTILGNLVDNALDATGEGGPHKRVHLGLQIDADRFVVRVEDSGPGIRPGERELVFRRGWSTKGGPAGLGRGIGLALVVQTVRRYGGDIAVATSDLGGASFTVTIRTVNGAGHPEVRS